MSISQVTLSHPMRLIAARKLHSQLEELSASYPWLPWKLDDIATELQRQRNGIPAQLRKDSKGNWVLALHTRSFVMGLYVRNRRGGPPDSYTIAWVRPLQANEHRALARGHLLISVPGVTCLADSDTVRSPPGAVYATGWERITAAAHKLGDSSPRNGIAPLPAAHQRFLDDVNAVIDVTERIATDQDKLGFYTYGSVRATRNQRANSTAMYQFQLIAGQLPPPVREFVTVRGANRQRGEVNRVDDDLVTVEFHDPIDWNSLPAEGFLDTTANKVTYAKQREAVDSLRNRQSRNPKILKAIVDREARPPRATNQLSGTRLDTDADQLAAFRAGLTVDDIAIVHGPPGTGKTQTITATAAAVARSGKRVLVTSQSNRAVDNVLPKLPTGLVVVRVADPNRVTAEGKPYLLESQADELLGRITQRLKADLDSYRDLEHARQWTQRLDQELASLDEAQSQVATAELALEHAKKAAGGRQYEVAQRLEHETQRLTAAVNKTTSRLERVKQRLRRDQERTTSRWLTVLYKPLERWHAHRRHRVSMAATSLTTTLEDTTARLRDAEEQLRATLDADPRVRQRRNELAQRQRETADRQSAAIEAAEAADKAVLPLSGFHKPGERNSVEALRQRAAWLHARIPQWGARHQLLTEWQQEVASGKNELCHELIRYAHVIATTCTGVASRRELSSVDFDLSIVDEAGQISVPDALIPLTRSRRAILVGDHQQLPPFAEQEVKDHQENLPATQHPLLTKSLLEILLDDSRGIPVVSLRQQRRMPEEVARFASTQFYKGHLVSAVAHETGDEVFSSPLAFIDTSDLTWQYRQEDKTGTQPGVKNVAEARMLAALGAYYHQRGWSWAVIVPYQRQKSEVIEYTREHITEGALLELNIGTVDSFQGGERDVIMYGFTRSNRQGQVGFLSELRRINVALTRAQRQLVMVGDRETLTTARQPGFRELANALWRHLEHHGDIRSYQEIVTVITKGNMP